MEKQILLPNRTPKYFISKLINSQLQSKIFHWQVTPNALAMHLVLDSYYNEIQPLTDSLVESLQCDGIIKEYTSLSFVDYKNKEQLCEYFRDLLKFVETNRKIIFSDSSILNIIDEIKTLIRTTIYKLENL